MAATMATTSARDSAKAKPALNYDSFTKKCETYVSANEKTARDIKCFLKALYGSVKEAETADGLSSGETLPELIIDNFDEEQIWQELELQNEARVDLFVGSVARLVAQKDRFSIDTGPAEKKLQNGDTLSEGEEEGSNEDDNEAEEDEDDIELDDDEDLRKLNNIDLNFDDDSDFSMPDGGEDDGEDDDQFAEEDGESEDYDLKPKKKSSKIPEEDEESEINESEDDEEPKKKSKSKSAPEKKKPVTPSIVDDKFFKLSEMEAFLEKEEAEDDGHSDGDSSEESVDLFEDYPSDEDDDSDENEEGDDVDGESGKRRMHYSDFFDAPEGETPQEGSKPKTKDAKAGKEKKVKFSFGSDDEGSDSDASETSDLNVPSKNEVKSSYEIRQEKLQAKIKALEDEAVSAKPWQHKGEISGAMRPENALLEEALEFDLTHRPAPVVTEETTQRLEDIIKQRIKDKAWDDVERKQKPVEAPSEFKKKLVLDQEKSKLSLAQVYEQEYLKKVAATEPESDKPDEIPKEHVEITTLVNSLFRKLDALSNFHYTPKQIAPEVKIVTNIPAINMEEVAPVATSDATLLAPEEVKAKPKGDVKSQEEKTDTDRKRERRQKKKHQKLKSRDREKREAAVAKLKPGLGNKYSKEKAVKLLEKVSKDSNVSLIDSRAGAASLKSSSAFFNQLQDEVTSQIKGKSDSKKRKNTANTMSAKRVKL
ncbi:U3 small nucleolar ribonucleoprotein protein MPP10 [Thrips palmi]|uniref:U3 small nucleolar ribonucleoprotein protein MPP10 n=1 Tax=Thrips palmi TaxID=161013 RepID=A0A6P8ZPQ8_THRPL|nr:U3 small nucleolar ribonucleoprotein protein MPP10 [Thrips palmi]